MNISSFRIPVALTSLGSLALWGIFAPRLLALVNEGAVNGFLFIIMFSAAIMALNGAIQVLLKRSAIGAFATALVFNLASASLLQLWLMPMIVGCITAAVGLIFSIATKRDQR